MTDDVTVNNENRGICARCGGDCCKTLPGIEWPERFINSPDPVGSVVQLLKSGQWVLATHYGIPYSPDCPPPDEIRFKKIYYPRPATVTEKDNSPLAENGVGCCCLLTDKGCSLEFRMRPKLCRELVPDVTGDCSASVSKGDAALAWLPHQWILAEALQQITALDQRP